MSEPTRLAELFAKVVSGTDLLAMSKLRPAWGSIVGEHASKNSKPLALKRGVLSVATRDAVWASQLSFMKDELLAKLEPLMPGAITDIRFAAVGWGNENDGADASVERIVELADEERAVLEEATKTAPKGIREHLAAAAVATKLVSERRKAAGWLDCPACGRLSPPTGCPRCKQKRRGTPQNWPEM